MSQNVKPRNYNVQAIFLARSFFKKRNTFVKTTKVVIFERDVRKTGIFLRDPKTPLG